MSAVAARLSRAFEKAPLLAERVARRVAPDGGTDAIIAAARDELARMTEPERVAVLDAHPRIGADVTTLSEISRREQGAAGAPEIVRELARLNEEYESRFGFRFVAFVAGRAKPDLVNVLRARLRRSRGEELATGIDEFLAIARDRLENAT